MKKITAIVLSVIAVMSFMLIPVCAEEEKTVSDIWVIKQPDKMEYFVGEKLDLTGIQLGVAYTDGSAEIVESGIEANISTLNQKGYIPVQLTFKGEPEIMTVHVDFSVWQKIVSIFDFLGSFFYITVKNIIAWF